jgi:AcrR family transcriptional regulator
MTGRQSATLAGWSVAVNGKRLNTTATPAYSDADQGLLVGIIESRLGEGTVLTRQAASRRRESLPPAQRERQLLDVALELLLTDENVDLTVEKVTAAAGVAKGTFYLYFNSKDHLLVRLWADYLEGFLATVANLLADVMPEQPDWVYAIDVLVEQIIRYDLDNAALHRAVFSRASGDALRMLHETDEQTITLFAAVIETAVSVGSATVSDPQTTAALLYYAVDGILNSAYITKTEADAEAIIAAAREMVHGTLRTDRQGHHAAIGSAS